MLRGNELSLTKNNFERSSVDSAQIYFTQKHQHNHTVLVVHGINCIRYRYYRIAFTSAGGRERTRRLSPPQMRARHRVGDELLFYIREHDAATVDNCVHEPVGIGKGLQGWEFPRQLACRSRDNIVQYYFSDSRPLSALIHRNGVFTASPRKTFFSVSENVPTIGTCLRKTRIFVRRYFLVFFQSIPDRFCLKI